MRIAWRWNERKGEGERKSLRERSSNSGAKDRIAGTRVPCSDRLGLEEGQQVGVELVLARVGQTVGATRIDL